MPSPPIGKTGCVFLVGVLVLLAALIADAVAAEETYITEPVSFPSGGLKIQALLGRPRSGGPFPAYISNHGSMTVQDAARGPWTSFTRGSLAETLAQRGYVVLAVARRGYRGSEGTTATYSTSSTSPALGKTAYEVIESAKAESADVVAALEYLASLPYVDRERIAVGGVSLGGLVSIMTAIREPRFKAVVSMAGGYRQTESGRSGGYDAAWPLVEEIWDEAAARLKAPAFLLWSRNDLLITPDVGHELYRRLRRAGKAVELKLYPAFAENGHYMFGRSDGYPVFVDDVVRFLDAQLKR